MKTSKTTDTLRPKDARTYADSVAVETANYFDSKHDSRMGEVAGKIASGGTLHNDPARGFTTGNTPNSDFAKSVMNANRNSIKKTGGNPRDAYGPKTPAKKGKGPSLPGSASGDQSRMEKATYHSDMLDAGKNMTAVNEATKGDKSDLAVHRRQNAYREAGRTKRNYRISKMGGESLEAGQYEMGAITRKTHSFRPGGANKLQPTFKPEKKRITPGNK